MSDAASLSASASATARGGSGFSGDGSECDFRGRYHADSTMWELSVAYGATVQDRGCPYHRECAGLARIQFGFCAPSAAAAAEASAEASATSAAISSSS